MAVHVTGIEGITTTITGIIKKRSTKEITNYLGFYEKRLVDIAHSWQFKVRELLSSPAVAYFNMRYPVKNESKWPRMRTGGLRRSINDPDVKLHIRSKKFQKSRGKAAVAFTVSNFFSDGDGNYLRIGNILNDMQEPEGGAKPFAGWKERAMKIFYDAIEHRKAFDPRGYNG